MVAQQEEFNARLNLLMYAEVGYLHDIEDGGNCNLLSPWMGEYLHLLPQ